MKHCSSYFHEISRLNFFLKNFVISVALCDFYCDFLSKGLVSLVISVHVQLQTRILSMVQVDLD